MVEYYCPAITPGTLDPPPIQAHQYAGQLYPEAAPWALTWAHRLPLMMREVAHWGPDVVCMQVCKGCVDRVWIVSSRSSTRNPTSPTFYPPHLLPTKRMTIRLAPNTSRPIFRRWIDIPRWSSTCWEWGEKMGTIPLYPHCTATPLPIVFPPHSIL